MYCSKLNCNFTNGKIKSCLPQCNLLAAKGMRCLTFQSIKETYNKLGVMLPQTLYGMDIAGLTAILLKLVGLKEKKVHY